MLHLHGSEQCTSTFQSMTGWGQGGWHPLTCHRDAVMSMTSLASWCGAGMVVVESSGLEANSTCMNAVMGALARGKGWRPLAPGGAVPPYPTSAQLADTFRLPSLMIDW
eukprot:CAMPEP_0206143536 /NCGR_PEP_ID=MMETSP1473-20131121/20939_1 /ASSEMBLY_ACC=CAM_ASM_001109 /TAXON_ID=1461547 /ORGANISM="Stichococcus sp, Strain RCC1054" /LENGTH=108 /DNA_ID=CAMNT_0053538991 /DNA_START=209 /DNA_END=533 /DNA_ORIENTATION=-